MNWFENGRDSWRKYENVGAALARSPWYGLHSKRHDFGDTLGYAVCLVSRLENAATHVWQSSLNCSCVFSSAAVAPMSMSAAYHLLLATSEIP